MLVTVGPTLSHVFYFTKRSHHNWQPWLSGNSSLY